MPRTLELRALVVLAIISISSLPTSTGCRPTSDRTLTLFAAASLGATLERLGAAFERERQVDVRVELSSSRIACAKVADQGRAGDLVLSADYYLIDELLRPRHAEFNLTFAANALVLAYRSDLSSIGSLLSSRNPVGQRLAAGEAWQRVLADADVRVGIANPEFAPVGYRAMMALALNDLSAPVELRRGAEIAARIERRYQRPNATALLAPLETGELDAAFLYRSDAEAHQLAYVVLDAAIDFSLPAYAEQYARVARDVGGVTIRGAPAIYGLTIPRQSRNRDAAIAFIALLLSPMGRSIAAAAHLRLLPPAQLQLDGEAPTALIQALHR